MGEVVLLHGLEGSGEAGYIRSMAWDALNAGFIAHRFHMRTCGGTAHSLQDSLSRRPHFGSARFLEQLERERSGLPVFLIGFSLGGNVALKLAGELGETELIHGVCAISTPIDLAAGVRRIGQLDNRLYERRFLKRMRERLFATGRYSHAELEAARTLYEIDDRITAPSFGFEGADHYYATQSAQNLSRPDPRAHAADSGEGRYLHSVRNVRAPGHRVQSVSASDRDRTRRTPGVSLAARSRASGWMKWRSNF